MKIPKLFFPLVFALAACTNSSIAPKINKEAFFTNASVVDDIDCLNKSHSNLELSCHRLTNSNHQAVGVREFSSSDEHHFDKFKKLTIVFSKKVRKDDIYQIGNLTEAYFSYGLTYSLGKVGCYGAAKAGSIHVLNIDETKIVLDIKIDFEMKSPSGIEGRCKQENYSEILTAYYKPYESLTVWDGVSNEKSLGINEAHPL